MDIDALGRPNTSAKRTLSDSEDSDPDSAGGNNGGNGGERDAAEGHAFADRDDFSTPSKVARVDGRLNVQSDSTKSNEIQSGGLHCLVTPACDRLGLLPIPEYELHVARFHTNVCSICRRLLPTPHFLSLHLEECHDSFFAARAARGDRCYRCFAPTCQRAFRHPDKRKRHMVDKHGYPKDVYNWNVVLGIRQREGVAGTVVEFGGGGKAKQGAKTTNGRGNKSAIGSSTKGAYSSSRDSKKPEFTELRGSKEIDMDSDEDHERHEQQQEPAPPSPSLSMTAPISPPQAPNDGSSSSMDLELPSLLSHLTVQPRSNAMVRKGRGSHPAFFLPTRSQNQNSTAESKILRPKEEGWGEGKIEWGWKRAVPRNVAMKMKKEKEKDRMEVEKDVEVEGKEKEGREEKDKERGSSNMEV